MEASSATARVLRFGVFELDTQSGELRRHGLKIRLPDQSFQILRLLLERPRGVVTREELQKQLWTSDTFVDFDVGLNRAVRKLREALGHSAENPRFVETLPRRGDRFADDRSGANRGPGHHLAYVGDAISAREEAAARDWAGVARRRAPGGRDCPIRAACAHHGAVGACGNGSTCVGPDLRSELRDVLTIQQQIARAIAAAVQGRLAPPPDRAERRRAVDPKAYDAYLKGIAIVGQRTPDGYRSAVAYFEDAVARQPDFALAYAALAEHQEQFLFGGPMSPRETIPKAEAAARKALQLDETIAQAHRTLGQVLHYFYWQWED